MGLPQRLESFLFTPPEPVNKRPEGLARGCNPLFQVRPNAGSDSARVQSFEELPTLQKP